MLTFVFNVFYTVRFCISSGSHLSYYYAFSFFVLLSIVYSTTMAASRHHTTHRAVRRRWHCKCHRLLTANIRHRDLASRQTHASGVHIAEEVPYPVLCPLKNFAGKPHSRAPSALSLTDMFTGSATSCDELMDTLPVNIIFPRLLIDITYHIPHIIIRYYHSYYLSQ